MGAAILTLNRIQDLLDGPGALGAGDDGLALLWDDATGAFVTGSGGVSDHGALSGLGDVADHPGYLTLDGSRQMSGDLIFDSTGTPPRIYEASGALTLAAAGSAKLIVQSSNVQINTALQVAVGNAYIWNGYDLICNAGADIQVLGGELSIIEDTAANTPLTITLASAQSADALRIKNSAGTTKFGLNYQGALSANWRFYENATPNYWSEFDASSGKIKIQFTGGVFTTPPCYGISGWNGSCSSGFGGTDQTPGVVAGGSGVQLWTSSYSAMYKPFKPADGVPSNVVVKLQGHAAQTGDLLQGLDSAGTVLSKMRADGSLSLPNGAYNAGAITVGNAHLWSSSGTILVLTLAGNEALKVAPGNSLGGYSYTNALGLNLPIMPYTDAASPGLRIKARTSQTGPLLRLEDANTGADVGSTLAQFGPTGILAVPSIQQATYTSTALLVTGAADYPGSTYEVLLHVKDSGGTTYLKHQHYNAISEFTLGGNSGQTSLTGPASWYLAGSSGYPAITITGPSTNPTATIQSNQATQPTLKLKMAAAQSALPLEVITSASAEVFGIGTAGEVRTGTTAAATSLGSVSNKMPIYDAAGSLVGYIPIYDSIT